MKILLIEDDQTNLIIARAQLAGHDLTVLSGFDQALEALAPVFHDDEAIAAINAKLPAGWTCSYISYYSGQFSAGYRLNGERPTEGVPDEVRDIVNAIAPQFVDPTFDALLTDVMFPKGGFACMGPTGQEVVRRQGVMPYGPVVALHALQAGVKKIGIITAGDHHSDPFVFAFDRLGKIELGDATIICTNQMGDYFNPETCERYAGDDGYKLVEQGKLLRGKDWAKLLGLLTGEVENED